MGKHRKKSKRQKSEASGDEGPCHDPAVKSMSPVLSSTESKHGSEEKKRKRKEDEPIVSSEALLEQDSSSKAKCRKKKKSKKSKKKRSGDEVDLTEESSSSHSVEIVDDTSPLEGSMVGDGQMVLIDRTKGIVFDAFDREENGARKQVGIVKDGKIQLTTVNEKQKDDVDVTPPNEDEDDSSSFPFETDPDDHCESPVQAYQDMLPFLNACGKKTSSALRIYDPYFCNGAVQRNMESLGFPNVYNKKEDCYQVWKSPNRYPSFDILITNPPYSADHIDKLVKHITSSTFGDRPWMLLLPQWVHKKDYYAKGTAHIQPFYLVPKKRYVYLPPPSFRQAKKSDVHKKSSPFVSMWYLWGGTVAQNERWLSLARKCSNCDVARSKSALRDLRRKGHKK